jgi:FkbM family methyltransferase
MAVLKLAVSRMSSWVLQHTRYSPRPSVRRFFTYLGGSPLIGPLLKSTARRALAVTNERVWHSGPYGWLKIDPAWHEWFKGESAEIEVTTTLKDLLHRGMCCYDIGANIGFYSLLASRQVGPEGKVVAFEPDPRNCDSIREMIQKNGLTNVELEPAAVWREDGTVRFVTDVIGGAASGHVSGSGVLEPVPHLIDCRAVRLDTFIRGSRAPDLLKVDVEGAEVEVLQGATGLLAARRPKLIVEVHRAELLPRILEILGPLGYRVDRMETVDEFPGHYLVTTVVEKHVATSVRPAGPAA